MAMKFFFPDSQDQIDPTFDFDREASSPDRVRQRDDRYAHEVISPPPYSGMLLSKALIEICVIVFCRGIVAVAQSDPSAPQAAD